MAAQTFILAHDNQFNKSVINNNAFYFDRASKLVDLLKDKEIIKNKNSFIKNNLLRIDEVYRWSIVVNEYESYFKRILDNK